MKLHELRSPAGSPKSRTRVGRGISAGQGKTSGRGTKGASTSQGAKTPRGFEGGQMRLTMRLPKLRGFRNHSRVEATIVNLSKLNRFPDGAIVDGAALHEHGLVKDPSARVKLLAAGRLQGRRHRPRLPGLGRCPPRRRGRRGSRRHPRCQGGRRRGGGERGVNLLQALSQAIRIPELRKKLLFTLGLLLAYRVLAAISIPGANATALGELFGNNSLLGLLNLFSGSGLSSSPSSDWA